MENRVAFTRIDAHPTITDQYRRADAGYTTGHRGACETRETPIRPGISRHPDYAIMYRLPQSDDWSVWSGALAGRFGVATEYWE